MPGICVGSVGGKGWGVGVSHMRRIRRALFATSALAAAPLQPGSGARRSRAWRRTHPLHRCPQQLVDPRDTSSSRC